MKPRLFALNPVLSFGYAVSAIGGLALTSLLLYNRGLEDTVPFVLYMTTAVALPVGFMLCIVGVTFNWVKRTRHRP